MLSLTIVFLYSHDYNLYVSILIILPLKVKFCFNPSLLDSCTGGETWHKKIKQIFSVITPYKIKSVGLSFAEHYRLYLDAVSIIINQVKCERYNRSEWFYNANG